MGITPNGYSEPDFMGWEVKQFGVDSFDRVGSATITLMTPEPTEGLYVSQGVDCFIRTYGYPDQNGKPDRLNFGGIHKAGGIHNRTRLTMELIGFGGSAGKIRSSTGHIALDEQGTRRLHGRLLQCLSTGTGNTIRPATYPLCRSASL